MLGYIRGKVIAKNEDAASCVVLAHRLGYEITLPRAIVETISVGDSVSFWLHTHVREDILALFGFRSNADRQFFRVLLGVSGLGPKTALALISEHGVGKLVQLILEKNFIEISEAAGVGKKLAERLVLELSGKIEKLAFLKDLEKPSVERKSTSSTLRNDLNSAMLNLGYPPNTVKSALDGLFAEGNIDGINFEDALKRTLKEMYRRDA